jgi:hypothetical protein
MKYYILTFILAVVTVSGTGCEQVNSAQNERTKPKPTAGSEVLADPEPTTDDEALLLDDEPLLLLDDNTEEESSTESMADNSRCFVCHYNYMQEDIAVTHARAGMGCAHCHGESDEHIADESWASGGNGTPPDIMYPLSKINPFCMDCHPKEKIDAAQHKVLFSNTGKQNYCTDCHGDHRLTDRKCKWK